jgi:hypothetical protein
MGSAGPPILNQFLTEQAFYQRLGLRRVDLVDYASAEIDRYALIMNVIQRNDNIKASQQAAAQRRLTGG